MIEFIIDRYDITSRAGYIWLGVPAKYSDVLSVFFHDVKKKGGKFTLAFGHFQRKRTTGLRSQNSRLHGNCSDIAEQLVDKDGTPTYTPEQIKSAMKRMGISENYPTVLGVDGVEEALPTRFASVEQLSIVLNVLNRFCDIHSLWLTEYDEEGLRYRSLAGRSRKEMELLDKKGSKG